MQLLSEVTHVAHYVKSQFVQVFPSKNFPFSQLIQVLSVSQVAHSELQFVSQLLAAVLQVAHFVLSH